MKIVSLIYLSTFYSIVVNAGIIEDVNNIGANIGINILPIKDCIITFKYDFYNKNGDHIDRIKKCEKKNIYCGELLKECEKNDEYIKCVNKKNIKYIQENKDIESIYKLIFENPNMNIQEIINNVVINEIVKQNKQIFDNVPKTFDIGYSEIDDEDYDEIDDKNSGKIESQKSDNILKDIYNNKYNEIRKKIEEMQKIKNNEECLIIS